MTGNSEALKSSTTPDTKKCDSESMHTLAPARSTNQPLLHHLQIAENNVNEIEGEYPLPVPFPPTATPVPVNMDLNDPSISALDLHCGSNSSDTQEMFENLKSLDSKSTSDMDKSPLQELNGVTKFDCHQSIMITSELLRLIPGENDINDLDITIKQEINEEFQDITFDSEYMGRMSVNYNGQTGPKTWSQQDMENALDALRNHNMSLTKASSTFGIPSTTLWQRAHRLGIDTPKKEGPSKSWSEDNLHNALLALRTGAISANKASKAYGIPSSTLYKIARREGIRLAAPFNAAPTTWRPDDLEKALQSIRSGHFTVQRASTEFGIPTGTLYGRCKREGIELSRSNPTPWSEDAMGEALEAVRVGQMSINQAAIHYNLPYSSLYGRFKRCRYENDTANTAEPPHQTHPVNDVQHSQQEIQPLVLADNLQNHSMISENNI